MPTAIDPAGQADGSVTDCGHYVLHLSAPRSHILTTEPGRGDLVIGPAAMGGKADLHVDVDDALRWSAFNPFATPAGSPWPRFIHYCGNDSGFFGWARQRVIERIAWEPRFADVRHIDASAARIHALAIHLDGVRGHLHLNLPPDCGLSLHGEPSRLSPSGAVPDSLSLLPTLGRRSSQAPWPLPDLGLLQGVRSLSLHAPALGQAISLRGIERFTALESLSLWGQFADWEALAQLPLLRSLQIRFIPDLSGLPPLASWPRLDLFIAYNVDEAGGKRLRAQIKARGKLRAWGDYTSVTQLRKPDWWQREYGRPFAAWRGRTAKAANTAYDEAAAALAQAQTVAQVRMAIAAFSARFNGLKGIETSERDDIGEAVWQLSQLEPLPRLGVDEAQALAWFDEVRDY